MTEYKKEMVLNEKDILKVKDAPEIKTYFSKSKDGKWFIIRRIETQIVSCNYIKAVLDNQAKESDATKKENRNNLIDELE